MTTTEQAEKKSTALARMEWGDQGAKVATFDDAWRLAQVFSRSGFFRDAMQDPAQAMVKIQAGAELGFSPMASMMNIFLVDGKPGFGASLVLARIIREGGRPKIVKHDANACEIEWSRKWPGDEKAEVVGRSSFTLDEAKQAGLYPKKDNWSKYPKAMLYARAVTSGARMFFPDLFLGAVYDPEELFDTIPMGTNGEPDVARTQTGVETAPKKARARGTSGSEKLAAAAKQDAPSTVMDAEFTEGPPATPTESPPPASSDVGQSEPASEPAGESISRESSPTPEPSRDGASGQESQPTPAASEKTASSSSAVVEGKPSVVVATPSDTKSQPATGPKQAVITEPPAEGATIAMALACQPQDQTGITKHYGRWSPSLPTADQDTFKLAARRAFNIASNRPEWTGIDDAMKAAITTALEEAAKLKK